MDISCISVCPNKPGESRGYLLRRTIAKTVSISGVGLHSGQACKVNLVPAELGGSGWLINGLRLRELDVVSGQLATSLQVGQKCISTVEHLFAALQAHEIDDLAIEIEGGEVPILEGSAQKWFSTIQEKVIAGDPFLCAPTDPIVIQDGDSRISFTPDKHFSASVHVQFEGYKDQVFDGQLSDFGDAAAARTFGYLDELPHLQKHGLALGAAADNVLALSRDGRQLVAQVPVQENELAKHKWVDLIGDLALVGARIRGRVEAERSGHRLHHQLVAKLREVSL